MQSEAVGSEWAGTWSGETPDVLRDCEYSEAGVHPEFGRDVFDADEFVREWRESSGFFGRSGLREREGLADAEGSARPVSWALRRDRTEVSADRRVVADAELNVRFGHDAGTFVKRLAFKKGAAHAVEGF